MLEEYLSQKGLVDKVFTLEEIKEKISKGRPINILMGQSYDDGQPINLLKYSLFIMNFQDVLKQEGTDSTATILLADHFMTDFNKEMSKEDAFKLGKERENFLQKLNQIYNGNIDIQYSSKLSKTKKYRKILKRLEREKKKNLEFKNVVLQAVPEKRRNNPNALRYPFEEITCIASLNTDIKVGPKYEIFYDKPSRDSADMIGMKKYSAIHLTNSWLLGKEPKLDEKIKKEIEEFGILPYQIRSKGLENNRIDLNNFNIEQVNSLINYTEEKKSLLDLLVITELARQRIEGKPQIMFFADNAPNLVMNSDTTIDFLRDQAKTCFKQYIDSYLNK